MTNEVHMTSEGMILEQGVSADRVAERWPHTGLLSRIFDFVHLVSRWSARLGGVITVAVMLLIIVSVVKRAITGLALPLVVQAVELSIVSLVALCLAHTWQVRGHVGIDLLVNALGPRWQSVLKTVSSLIVLLLCLYLVSSLVPYAISSYERGETIGMGGERLIFWPARIIIAFGFVWLLLEVLISVIQSGREFIVAMKEPRRSKNSVTSIDGTEA